MSYNDVLSYLHKKNREHHLLMGNGFSISYDRKIFSYNALHRYIMDSDNEKSKEIFDVLNTQNFESVMQQLDNFSAIAKIFKTPENVINDVESSINDLRSGLLNAVGALHPEQVFTVPEEKSIACASFINEYTENNGHVFSTNYDLLLYWILMRNGVANCVDGFGRYVENQSDDEYVSEDDLEWSDLTWGVNKSTQNIHYVHGALPLFDDGSEIIKAETHRREWLIEVVKKKINEKKYPIFVSAGNSRQKMEHISHNKYLSFCYEKLTEIAGSLVVFGFSFGDNDSHIVDAINKASKFHQLSNGKKSKLFSIYIGVFSEQDYEHIKSIESKFSCKVNMYDARTANIWG